MADKCDRDGCTEDAFNALKFSQYDDAHTHACKQCTGYAYEYATVTECHPFPCPWPHLGEPWQGNIARLES